MIVLTVQFHSTYVPIFLIKVLCNHSKYFTICQLQFNLFKFRLSNFIFTWNRIYRIKAHSTEHIPCRHLSAILISTQTSRGVQIQFIHNLRHILLRFPRLIDFIIQIGHMMARLISVCILSNHTCTKDRQFVVVRRVILKHAVKLLAKALFSSHQTNKTIHIMLYRPEIMPCIAFTNMWRIFLGMEILDKITFIIFRLHKRSSRIVHIPVILRTGIESIRNVLPSHLGSHFSYTKIIERIFQCSWQRPVLGIIFICDIVRDISLLLIKANASILINIRRSYTSFQCLFGIKITDTLQIRIHNNWHCVVTNHHVCFTSVEVPHWQTAILFVEGDEGFHHVVHTRRLYISIKRMRGTVRIP